MKTINRQAIRSIGFDVVRYRDPTVTRTELPDLTDSERLILRQIVGYSMTSAERQLALIQAVRHIIRRNIPGSIVECGVWRGGSSMVSALTLLQEQRTDRNLYLYDTFEGMTPPTEVDQTRDGVLAQTHLERDVEKTGYWCVADLNDVQQNMRSTQYPMERVHFIKGPVEQTIPQNLPQPPIAILRLDTDWYESTRHELLHLYPLVSPGGIVIIDDYGHWTGAKKAVDEFLANLPMAPFLHRIDYTGRLFIKS
jgi:hypothetical protein